MFTPLLALVLNEEGSALMEYGLLVALIALVALTAVHSLGRSVSALYTGPATAVTPFWRY